jgi:glyoxylase-like metal-dependent hydrolase (beta-lactamase superfamily II)
LTGDLPWEERDLIIEHLVVGPLQTNCYIVADKDAGDGMVIDPGGDADRILAAADQLDVGVKLVLNTHGHFDHIMANEALIQATGAELAIHGDDADMLTNPLKSFSLFMAKLRPSPAATLLLIEGMQLSVGKESLTVLHTPGHSPGSISLWCEAESVVFTGDALFHMGIGRTDFPGGSYQTLLDSVREKLFVLPDDTVVYSGHGPQTTIGQERRHNPFLS